MSKMVNSNIRLEIMIKLGGAVFCAGSAIYLFYQLFKKDNDDDDIIDHDVTKLVLTDNLAKLEVEISRQHVGVVIGRQGCNVKLIQELTSTSIRFKDNADKSCTCIIMGKIEKAAKAKEMILKAVNDVPSIETKEVYIRQTAVGRVIGRQGITVDSISRSSGAKVKIDKNRESGDESFDSSEEKLHRIILQGTSEQIDAAEKAIINKVEEERSKQENINASASKMSMRSKKNDSLSNVSDDAREEGTHHQVIFPDDKFIQVYISSVETPFHFWVQIVSQSTVEIDKLVNKMTEYYNDESNRKIYKLDNTNVGDAVAAIFSQDDSWYRGRIVSEDSDKKSFKVFFVDFGDTEDIPIEKMCELRTDFLKLNFQAMECYLADIDAKSVKTQKSLDTFESLSYAMEWKPIMLKVSSYKKIGGKTVPFVTLIDTSGPKDVNVAEELENRKLAKWDVTLETEQT